MSEITVRAEVIDKPRLDELAATVRTEHGEIQKAFSESLGRAIVIGEAFIEAKSIIGRGNFTAWVELECGVVSATATFYMRVAHYQSALPNGLNYSQAVDFLRGLPPINGNRPSTHYPEAIKAEGRRRRRQGESFGAIADALGVEKSTVQYWCRPRVNDAAKARARARALRRAEKREALRQQAAAAAKKRGGSIAEAWSLARRLSQELDRAAAEYPRGAPVRKELGSALSFSYAVEKHLSKALGIDYGSSEARVSLSDPRA